MLRLRNKKNNFLVRTLIWRSDPNVVIVGEFVKIRFVTVCYRSFRLQGIAPKHLIGLVVIVAYFTITFSLISFLNKHACHRIASN